MMVSQPIQNSFPIIFYVVQYNRKSVNGQLKNKNLVTFTCFSNRNLHIILSSRDEASKNEHQTGSIGFPASSEASNALSRVIVEASYLVSPLPHATLAMP